MLTHALWAQTGAGSIQGRISDSQQLAMPQVSVEVDDPQGNTVQKVMSDDTGHYQISALAAGSYTLKFSRDGFATVTKGPVTIMNGQPLMLDASLQPETAIQNIVVLGSADDRQVASKTAITADLIPVTTNTVPLELIQEQNSTDIVSAVNSVPGANAWTQYGSLN